MFSLSSITPFWRWRSFQLGLLACAVGAVTLVIGAVSPPPSPPLVDLATEPLYINGAKTKANLTLAVSVEFPTVGQTYRDQFNPTKTYVGYFDPKSCYKHVPANGVIGPYFDWAGAANRTAKVDGVDIPDCGGGGFNGNFMNWATSSAIDIMRYGLTGGNRVIDDDRNKTVVERAWLPDFFYRSGAYFAEKTLDAKYVPYMIEQVAAGKFKQSGSQKMYIYNCRDRVYFATAQDTTGGCTNPFNVDDAQSPNLIGPANKDLNQKDIGNFYSGRNLVCDSNSATNRLMTYDPDTKKWTGLCWKYPNGNYKPVGQFQMNAENLRVSVFGYLQDDSRDRYGGVMRSPLKYLGPRAFDANFNLVSGTNPRTEWNKDTGVFTDNPQSGDATYDAQGHARSGAIMYINKFGTLNFTQWNPRNASQYKALDPVSELYYESLRYLQGKQPTAGAVSLSGDAAAIKALKENFPVYATWSDPFNGFQDAADPSNSCLRNSILGIADVFTHSDRSVPGNKSTADRDYARAVESNPDLDVPFWTSIVGSFEANSGVSYTDSKGRTQAASNISANSPYQPTLANAATMDTGATGGSYYMAGLAYWANTQSFRKDIPKARVKTYTIDVNENRASDNVDFRRTRQLYLAAKYGGFDDAVAGNTGNPFTGGSNTLWQATDGDAKNYFLVSDAQKFLDSIADVFARVVEETGSIAGGAISTQRLTSSEAAAVFQARFNPVANYWSGRVLKYPISASGSSIVIGATPTWEAGQVLTTAAKADYGAARNIVIGPPIDKQGVVAPTPFLWSDLDQAHKDVLNSSPAGVTDTLGLNRLQYLRGDQRDEQNAGNPTGPFRPRDIVLGDIVNSGLVYMGKPSLALTGAGFRTFYDANKDRKPVIFVNANDGMLHAFNDADGKEAFAYIPGFLAKGLNRLPDQDYSHASFADATPAVGEAYFGGKWRTALVSGVGGGARGVYALDVSDPASFSKSSALWEFTERDHPAMGNVLGTPQILKFRVTASSASSPTYKWFAVVASGVNNYAPGAYSHASGNPSLFVLDLDFVPSPTAKWQEGSNFWRIELPQTSTSLAKGLVGFTSVGNVATGAVNALYAGDLQGNMWKLDFSAKGTSTLGADAASNFAAFNPISSSKPLYVAKDSNGSLQPITSEPAILSGYAGKKVVAFGTGKFLETADTSVPLAVTASFYAVMDDSLDTTVPGRASLQKGTTSVSGTVTVPPFIWGAPATTATPPVKSGWFVDLDASAAERQISDITAAFGKLFFATVSPTKGSCGDGGGNLYVVDALTGSGTSEQSQVGVLAAPLVLRLGVTDSSSSDTTGQRKSTEIVGLITQGAKGLKTSNITNSFSFQTGRLSWRQINNYQANKAAP